MEGDVKTVELLLDAGAALEDLGGECGTPLQATAAGGHKRVVELLLRPSANAKVVHSFQFFDEERKVRLSYGSCQRREY